METVTVKGRVYKVNYPYLMPDGQMGYLTGIVDGQFSLIAAKNITDSQWEVDYLHEIFPGTITDAPIELEDGEMFLFTYEDAQCLGFYSKANDTFINYESTICFINEAILITPLRERT